MEAMKKPKILFFCEGLTLAHVVRLHLLAKTLDPNQYDIYMAFASDPKFIKLIQDEFCQAWKLIYLKPVSSEQFFRNIKYGKSYWTEKVFRDEIQEDKQLISELQPDLIIGDMRLSLSISARLLKVKYAALTNAYWHPDSPFPGLYPHYAFDSLVPSSLSQFVWNKYHSKLNSIFLNSINTVRLAYQFESYGGRVQKVWTDGDYVLFADPSYLYPEIKSDNKYFFLGPLTWEPQIPFNVDFEKSTKSQKMVYIGLGSSGDFSLKKLTLAFANSWDKIIVSAAGKKELHDIKHHAKIFKADYIPGSKAAQYADVVICNGGSISTYQSLLEGKPVIGLCSNLDQFLNMNIIQQHHLGRLLRTNAKIEDILLTAEQVRVGQEAKKAQEFRKIIHEGPSTSQVFQSFIEQVI